MSYKFSELPLPEYSDEQLRVAEFKFSIMSARDKAFIFDYLKSTIDPSLASKTYRDYIAMLDRQEVVL